MKGMNNLTIRAAQIIAAIEELDEDRTVAAYGSEGREALCASMDLDEDNLNELFVTASRIADKYVSGDYGIRAMLVAHEDAWQNNHIQMPRLLSEIMAACEDVSLPSVAALLRISLDDLNALIDAAGDAWEASKAGEPPAPTGFVAVAVAHLPGDEESSVHVLDVAADESRADIAGRIENLLYEDAGLDKETVLAGGGRGMYLDSLFVIDGRVVSESVTPR